MGLTTVLTTIGFVHQNPPECEILISKEIWTAEDLCGRAADVGVKGSRVQACEAWDSLSLVEVRHSSCISGDDRSASRKAVGNAGLGR